MRQPKNKQTEQETEEFKKIIFQEISKCAADYKYCLNNYAKIPVSGKGIIPFKLREYQKKTLGVFEKKNDTIILKSRQLGISTLVAGFIACGMKFEERFVVLIIATKRNVAKKLLDKVKIILESFPDWLMPVKIIKNNAQSIVLDNGARCEAVASTDDAGRCEDLSLLVVDEAAHIDNVATIWTGASETLAETNGQTIVVTTPNGVGNWFHQKWEGAVAGENNFYPIKLPWYVHPKRDKKWKKERIKATSPREFSQEHECSFLTTGGTLIDGEKLKQLEKLTTDPQWKIETKCTSKDRKALWMWKKPEKEREYLISADTADSGDGDYNAAHVIELENCEQVAEYKAHSNPGDFGHLLVDLAIKYNHALLVIERNNLGPAVIQPSLDRYYENLFWSKRGSLDFVDPNLNNSPSGGLIEDKTKASVKPGFTTSRKTRPLVIQKIDDYIRDDSIKINSVRLISELFVFINVNGKYEAMQGYNDDLVMAMAIGLFIRETALKLANMSNKLDNKRMEAFLQSGVKNKQIRDQTRNIPNLIYTNSNNNDDPYKMKHKNDDFDLRDLL